MTLEVTITSKTDGGPNLVSFYYVDSYGRFDDGEIVMRRFVDGEKTELSANKVLQVKIREMTNPCKEVDPTLDNAWVDRLSRIDKTLLMKFIEIAEYKMEITGHDCDGL